MTTYSQNDLATRVLRDLGVVAVDETPTDDDLSDAKEIIGSEIAAMSTRGIQIWNGSEYSVPMEYLSPLSRRLGLSVAPAFGMPLDQAVLAIEAAERYLRQMNSQLPTGVVADGEFY